MDDNEKKEIPSEPGLEETEKKRAVPQKSVMTIRLLVGCYLLYIDYSVIGHVGDHEGWQKILLIACLLLFLVAGGWLIYMASVFLWKDWKMEREQAKAEAPPKRSLSEKAHANTQPSVEQGEADLSEKEEET